MSSVARNKMAIYIDTTPTSTATYTLLGVGITELSVEYNPQTTTEQDIVSATADTEITGYQPTAGASMKVNKGDDVYNFINGLRKKRALLGDALTEIILVDLYENESSGAYPAEKQPVSISIDNYGGAATDPLSIGFTVNYKGDAEVGTYNPTTSTFVKD